MNDKLSEIRRTEISSYQDYRSNPFIVSPSLLDTTVSLHWHDHYEVEYVLSGTGTHVMNGTVYPIGPGTLHFLTLTDFHELYSDDPIHDPVRIIKLSFRESDLPASVFQTISELSPNLILHFSGEEKALYDTLFPLAQKQTDLFFGRPENAVLSRNLVECILIHIFDHCRRNGKLHPPAFSEMRDINRILTYIHRNFRTHITLQSVSEYARFSPNYLSRLFHQSVGVTFKEYLTRLRLDFAARLIVNSHASITEICYESGFGSLSNFIREFKKLYSLSPSEYRTQHKASEN